MKTTTQNPDPAAVVETDPRRQHNDFIQFSTREDRYRRKVSSRPVDTMRKDGINLPVQQREYLLEPRLHVGPEFFAYTFHLEGLPRQLLAYLMVHEVDYNTGKFRFDDQVIHRFGEYCELFGKPCKEGVVRSGIRKLVEMNIVVNISRGRYMINPLLGVGTTEAVRREQIKAYTRQLVAKGKDPHDHFYPVYTIPV
ncbi:hypothetical protein [Paracnuella aquatica]|uniref:hypothetical protein n=1 Tax=Paracnuella aquatica TaxID=2268757 RepID=UPI000F4F578F|nr:hypothetical protein [Paracnuella aquatica]RPD51414.1 hypothetical protein DRJ53_01650 [Paracnuella aquatica]